MLTDTPQGVVSPRERFLEACDDGDVGEAGRLLLEGADADEGLAVAASNGRAAVVAFLIDKGARVNVSVGKVRRTSLC